MLASGREAPNNLSGSSRSRCRIIGSAKRRLSNSLGETAAVDINLERSIVSTEIAPFGGMKESGIRKLLASDLLLVLIIICKVISHEFFWVDTKIFHRVFFLLNRVNCP